MKNLSLLFLLSVCIIAQTLPFSVYASTTQKLEVSGWVPFWHDDEGIKDAKSHISSIDTVYPFAYTVTQKGELKDLAGLGEDDWKSFVKTAKRKHVEIIPTVMSSDGAQMQAILSDSKLRAQHVGYIASMVKAGEYDGVGIDYEAKLPETIDYFSKFLKELKKALGSKILTCTIEARVPPDSQYLKIPDVIQYANDYTQIAKYCDRVEIMAYDQQRSDLKLDAERKGVPYMPVSDIDWVRKVITLALKDIPKEKIILGIPTYGHQYDVTVVPDWYRDYKRIGALNLPSMLELAKEYKVTPSRTVGGEMNFTYLPKNSKVVFPKTLKIPKDTPKGNIVSAQALAYANITGQPVTFRIATYSDTTAMEDKIDLAKELGLRGVALFKIDGDEDQEVWRYLK